MGINRFNSHLRVAEQVVEPVAAPVEVAPVVEDKKPVVVEKPVEKKVEKKQVVEKKQEE